MQNCPHLVTCEIDVIVRAFASCSRCYWDLTVFFHAMRRESGGDYSNTFSKSRTLKDASQRSTATHTIPKVTGEVRAASCKLLDAACPAAALAVCAVHSLPRTGRVCNMHWRSSWKQMLINAVCVMQWRIIDDNGNKVKSQEVLDMPRWCIHPFSASCFLCASYSDMNNITM